MIKGAGNKTSAAETTIVLYGQGPVEFEYVNPSDATRHARPARVERGEFVPGGFRRMRPA